AQTRDAARRAAEEESDISPSSIASPTSAVSPTSPRGPSRRTTDLERSGELSPSQKRPRRDSLLTGFSLFSRSKTEPVLPTTTKTSKPATRVKTDPITPAVTALRSIEKEKKRLSSSLHSS